MLYIKFIILILGVYISIQVFYNLVLIVANFFIKDADRPSLPPKTRFGIIIPAYNEELLLARLLKSINNQCYPSDMFKIIVTADNCTDNTANVAMENGALVLERTDLKHTGKGYAIKFALEKIDMNKYDAILIIDADNIVKDDLLKHLDQALTERKKIIQCYNAVANPDESWFTRLLDVARTIDNEIYHPAKQKLGLSSYLMGNGMCFSSEILSKYGWESFTVGEDWEYYAKLIQKGETIAFAQKARVYHQESSSLKQATSQRMRWSSGRFAIVWKYGLGLFWRGLVERNIRKLDASLPLIFPNPSLGLNITVIGLALSFFLPAAMNGNNFIIWFSCLILIQFVIFMIGAMFTQNRGIKFLSIFVAPLFLIWKMVIDIFSAFGMGRKKWIRTERRL